MPIIGFICWGWLIEERVDEFVVEKYFEMNKGIRISIMYVDPDPRSYSVTTQQKR